MSSMARFAPTKVRSVHILRLPKLNQPFSDDCISIGFRRQCVSESLWMEFDGGEFEPRGVDGLAVVTDGLAVVTDLKAAAAAAMAGSFHGGRMRKMKK
ncbi:hypothetical protein ACS0TY_012793 [Phlomoides rotata]